MLNPIDLARVVAHLPKSLKVLLSERRGVFLCGGAIRSILSGEEPSDYDVFCDSTERAESCEAVLGASNYKTRRSKHSINMEKPGATTIQIITAKHFASAEDAINSFDFTVCQAAVWSRRATSSRKWLSACSPHFYEDLATKRLRYMSPKNMIGTPASALLHGLEYIRRGYSIQPDDLSIIIGQMMAHKANITADMSAIPEADGLQELVFDVDLTADELAKHAFAALKEAGAYDPDGVIGSYDDELADTPAPPTPEALWIPTPNPAVEWTTRPTPVEWATAVDWQAEMMAGVERLQRITEERPEDPQPVVMNNLLTTVAPPTTEDTQAGRNPNEPF
jgi:hypothetical protein